jgi:hypothetical protein
MRLWTILTEWAPASWRRFQTLAKGVAVCLLVASPVLAQSGGGVDLTWNTVDGGGQTSTGGGYTLSGTAGQPDAGPLAGGEYTLGGGFWMGGAAAVPDPYRTYLPLVLRNYVQLYIVLGEEDYARGVTLDDGGDCDTEVVVAGTPALEARRTGNGRALPAPDGNKVADHHIQFNIDDGHIFAGEPTTRIVIAIEYLDEGTDLLGLQYDALSGGPFGDGSFKHAPDLTKAGTGQWRVLEVPLDDVLFEGRVHGGDFRILDHGDGAETVRRVVVRLLVPRP